MGTRNYIIPGSTMYWLPSGGNANNGTPTTKVINVRYINKSVSEDPTDSSWTAGSNEEKIEVLVSVYRDSSVTNDNKGNTSNYTNNTTEDLDLRTYVGGSNATMVFANRDGDEFTSLAYNWCLNRRREFLPKGFAWVVVIKVLLLRQYLQLRQASGATSLVLNNTTDLQDGDVIFGTGIASGTTITVSNSTTIALSDATTAEITANTKVSFTQSDAFGNTIEKFDTPEIFGIINGYERGTINLVIDLNPSADIDPSIKQYPTTAFGNYIAMLMQFRDDTNEDGGVTLPYKHNGPKRVTGTTSSRFQLLQVVPSDIYNSGSDPDI